MVFGRLLARFPFQVRIFISSVTSKSNSLLILVPVTMISPAAVNGSMQVLSGNMINLVSTLNVSQNFQLNSGAQLVLASGSSMLVGGSFPRVPIDLIKSS